MNALSLKTLLSFLAFPWLCLISAPSNVLAAAGDPPPVYEPAPDEFTPLANAVLELLKTGDAARFATNFAATADDYRSIVPTNLPPAEAKGFLDSCLRSVEGPRRELESQAKALVERAAKLKLVFSKGSCLAPEAKNLGSIWFSGLESGKIPHAAQLDLTLFQNGTANTDEAAFRITVRGAAKFPGGWRIMQGIQWSSFPKGILDENAERDLLILTKAANFKGISVSEDPALLKLGEVLVRFVREQNLDVLKSSGFLTSAQMWEQMEKTGRPGPSRADLDEYHRENIKSQEARASDCLKLMSDAGINLSNADIQIRQASVDQLQRFTGKPDSLAGLQGHQFKVKFAVTSEAKTINGSPISGDYILAIDLIMRMENDWKIMGNLQWSQLPEGVLSKEALEKLQLENYVAEYRSLPSGTMAPDIEFTALQDEKRMKLSDFKGKIVVLDFWATWCGPCQRPMADLQKLLTAHPDWTDKVVILPVSIDDDLETMKTHVESRGWTNTFNTWAGPGGWRSETATRFRVTGVPTTYVIDRTGKIARDRPFNTEALEREVTQLLKKQDR